MVMNEAREMPGAKLFYGLNWGKYNVNYGIVIIDEHMGFQSKSVHTEANIKHELVCCREASLPPSGYPFNGFYS